MTIVAAIGKACGIHGSCAVRPTGLIVVVKRQGGLRRVSDTGERAFQPALQDIVADDWDVFELAVYLQALSAAEISAAGPRA